MRKNSLIGISMFVIVLLVFGLLANVVGYQTVQSSNQKVINNEINQKELLFQTIIDLANNKKIQKFFLNSEMKRKGVFNPDIKFTIFIPHIWTKKYLNSAYHIGLILSKALSKSRIHSMLERYQVSNQGVQKEITAIIEKDPTLNEEIIQLLNSKCDCENDNTTSWNFPVLCFLLVPFWYLALTLYFTMGITFFSEIVGAIGSALHCFWI